MTSANATLCLPASLNSLAQLSNELYGFVEPFSLDPALVYQLDLALSEAFTNIVRHAVNYDDTQNIMIDLTNEGHHLTLTLSDPGSPIPDNILHQWAQPPDLAPDPLDQTSWPEGGMGLILIQSVMDKVQYESVNGRNRLTLSKSLL
ncbi:TPA: ATP-binding protein [Serratia fonticola]|uniref:ATP-binding protein n=1 Tax=Serratia fonticola TaxID=47917 RepID=UPI000BFBF68A|nr:ATP-binding protein [Serratia fonticola]ATM78157.1 serine/threonine protein kinase [Serratia fonticola]HEJ9056422.1 ATP-binding protein [Serratia fonticola]